MELSDCSFQKLPYSKLFRTYIYEFQKLKQFFPYNPLDEEQVLKRASQLKNFTKKESLIEALSAFHKQLGLGNQGKALQKLAQPGAMAVITGQQMGVYGGPIFTIYKTLTAILCARKYEKLTGRPVVPVFWIADEDHDFDEIAWVGIPGRNDFMNIYLDEKGNGKPIAEQVLTNSINTLFEEVFSELHETDFTDSIKSQLKKHYKTGATYSAAFAGLMSEWFAEQGLLIAGSNHPDIKKLVAEEMSRSIANADALFNAVEQQSVAIEALYHRQVMNGDSNLFYLSSKEGRVKIHKENDHWKAGSIKWKTDLLQQEILEQPEKFSPNVFLRPVIQDALLPNLGYVAGPGELAYYGQMKLFYEQFEQEMPPIFPRMCATVIESGIARILTLLPFEIPDYDKRLEDLEAEFIDKTDAPDLEEVFSNWKIELNTTAEIPLKVIDEIDPTLAGTAGKTIAGFEHELDKLKARVYRAIKNQHDTQLKRIERIKISLFPGNSLQERAVSPIYFMNKYGPQIWDDLLYAMEQEELDLGKHHIIKL